MFRKRANEEGEHQPGPESSGYFLQTARKIGEPTGRHSRTLPLHLFMCLRQEVQH